MVSEEAYDDLEAMVNEFGIKNVLESLAALIRLEAVEARRDHENRIANLWVKLAEHVEGAESFAMTNSLSGRD